jgi:hypothetical protein
MNAIQFLKKQHEEAKAGFQKVEQASEGQRGRLWQHVSPELKLHEQMEEQHLYGPISKEASDPKLKEWPEHHAKEVREAEQLIGTIDKTSPQEREWLEIVKKLHSALERHIREEEGEVWPKIEKTWDNARLEEAGKKMEAMKSQKEHHKLRT